MKKKQLLFLTVFLEGYIVLACEILALRLLVPHIGSGTEIASIIIAFVLLPLAAGYHYGGTYFAQAFQKARRLSGRLPSIRRRLLYNFLTAQVILTVGFSPIFLEFFFSWMGELGFPKLLQAAVFSSLFLIMPVFALGQTIPLISHYFLHGKLSRNTGRILFASTIGSFLGSVLSTVVFMAYIGVHTTIAITLGLISFLCLLVGWRGHKAIVLTAALFLALSSAFTSFTLKGIGMVTDNAYNTIYVLEHDSGRFLMINNSFSALLAKTPDKTFPYRTFIESHFINPFLDPQNPPHKILILGAGGFTIGLDDTHNDYTYVDIDREMKDVAEKDFLNKPLTPNKKFVADSARSFVRHDKEMYDLIVLDVFTLKHSLPVECITREFLLDMKKRLKSDGVAVLNIIADPLFLDLFSVRYHNTFTSVFPTATRMVMDSLPSWDRTSDKRASNVIYVFVNGPFVDDRGIYTDDKNSYEKDM